MKTKRVEYSYPSSPNADRLGFSRGCYTVELVEAPKPSVAIAGFATLENAKNFANLLPEPWDKLTR